MEKRNPSPWVLLSALALVLLSPLAPAAAYKWVDADGITHYSQFPPGEGPAQEVRVQSEGPRDAAAASARLKQEQEQLKAYQESRSQQTTTQQKSAQESAAREQNCQRARSNLNTLETFGRLRYTDAEGNVQVMGDEERQARQEEARKQVAEFCKP
jgi:hypothetical protein